MRSAFYTIIAALLFSLLSFITAAGIFLRSAFETLFLGRNAAAQLRLYEDDLNGRF